MPLVPHARTHVRTANKPRIGITMGDAAGIGPEIIVKALADKQVVAGFEPVVVGDVDVLRNVVAKLGTATVTRDELIASFEDDDGA